MRTAAAVLAVVRHDTARQPHDFQHAIMARQLATAAPLRDARLRRIEGHCERDACGPARRHPVFEFL